MKQLPPPVLPLLPPLAGSPLEEYRFSYDPNSLVEDDPLTGDKVRFGTQLPPQELLYLHRLSYWSRQPITDIMAQALRHYLKSFPKARAQAQRTLPENERMKRNQPRR